MSEIEINHISPTTYYSIQLEEMGNINKNISEYIYNEKSSNPSSIGHDKFTKYNHKFKSRSSTQGGWLKMFNKVDTHNVHIEALMEKIHPIINKIEKGLKWDSYNYTILCTSMWSIVNPKYSYNIPHTHKNSILSGAYYLKIPKNMEGGEFIITDPRSVCEYFPQPHYQSNCSYEEKSLIGSVVGGRPNETIITPKEGLLLIFPSWLEHRVNPHFSDGDRIVISFNIRQHPKIKN